MLCLLFYRDEEGSEKDESGAISGRECYQSGASMASGVPGAGPFLSFPHAILALF